jgi:hypothetical protein
MKTTLLLLMLSAGAVLAEPVPPEVRQVIDTAAQVSDGRLVAFYATRVKKGFDAGPVLHDVKIGRAVRVYGFVADSLRKLGEGAPLSSLLRPLNEWAVPLLLNGKVLMLLRVEKTALIPQWHAGGYGSGWTAKQWERVCRVWPEQAGYHPTLVGNLSGQCYFAVPEKGEHNLTPLLRQSSPKVVPDSLYVHLDSSRIVMKELKYRLWVKTGFPYK